MERNYDGLKASGWVDENGSPDYSLVIGGALGWKKS